MTKLRRPGIPGTLKNLNAEVLSTLKNRALGTPAQRAQTAVALITVKVVAAYRIDGKSVGETKGE